MKLLSEIRKLLQSERGRWIFLVGVLALTHMSFQSLLLPYGNALRSLVPNSKRMLAVEDRLSRTSLKTAVLRNPLAVNVSDISNGSGLVSGKNGNGLGFGNGNGLERVNGLASTRSELDGNGGEVGVSDLSNGEELDERIDLERFEDEEDSFIIKELAGNTENFFPLEKIVKPNGEVSMDNYTNQAQKEFEPMNVNVSMQDKRNVKGSALIVESFNGSSTRNLPASKNNSSLVFKPGKKKMRCEMPPKTVTTIDEMNRILVRRRRSSRAMRPRWSSKRDEEILAAKKEIENAPDATNDLELYAPIFRNVSMFKRSYEIMERMLKVYVYKEGSRPIFHTPILKGLYASEGWFMKLMENNKRYLVKDPRRAHLYYIPVSSRMLEHMLYVRNSHNRTNLRQYLKEYSENLASKYSFWNRTGGADHFLVACHDWAPYETRHHMEHCIKALCNADVTLGFKIGRDISLPETYVRAAKNPLRDLGGKPPSQRRILAFYAGSLHGYLRPILLKHWKNKDPEMKIFHRMPPGVASKMNYIQHMKNSKYCICPKGYEVNSPRVVESIFYECVPVIVSDNFVLPFFDVLNWEAFAVVVAEKDIPRLKEILISIPEERYVKMQIAVKKAQRHFLWHAKPEKYDLFHMTLHSIWYNRVFQVKRR